MKKNTQEPLGDVECQLNKLAQTIAKLVEVSGKLAECTRSVCTPFGTFAQVSQANPPTPLSPMAQRLTDIEINARAALDDLTAIVNSIQL